MNNSLSENADLHSEEPTYLEGNIERKIREIKNSRFTIEMVIYALTLLYDEADDERGAVNRYISRGGRDLNSDQIKRMLGPNMVLEAIEEAEKLKAWLDENPGLAGLENSKE